LSEGQLRLGLVECLGHSLLHPYPVLHEKQGDLVAQVRLRSIRRDSSVPDGRERSDVAGVLCVFHISTTQCCPIAATFAYTALFCLILASLIALCVVLRSPRRSRAQCC
jgi:hypothetical protein